MVLAAVLSLAVVAAYVAGAAWLVWRRGLVFRHAALYLPFKLLYRISDRAIMPARGTAAPVIYTIVHQSRLDPALMLALLPEETLHILDEESATAAWLEPFRDLARSIAFNAEHVFVSRRLVRHLKGKGRLAVYLPDEIEPDAKAFRLYRAVARIAQQADAEIVPIFIDGAGHLPSARRGSAPAQRRLMPRLRIVTLPPAKLSALVERAGRGMTTSANALFDQVAEARMAAVDLRRNLVQAVVDAAVRHGSGKTIVEDPVAGAMTYSALLTAARVLGTRFASMSAPGEAIGIMLPSSNAAAISLLGTLSGGRVAALMNFTAGPANNAAAVQTAAIRTVVSSRVFVGTARLQAEVAAIEAAGARMLWLEDVRKSVSVFERGLAALRWRQPIGSQDADAPAVILFTSGSEGSPKAVVLSSANLVANAAQAAARISLSAEDRLLNVLPVFHSFGLTGGLVLPLLAGVRFCLYPSPLHYKLIPTVAKTLGATILFGTDTFLAAYAKTAKDEDFASLRLVVAGAEPVRPETRQVWRRRFGAEIAEGYGMTEAAPVVAVNTSTHGREGTVGRALPGMRLRLEPVEGIADAGRLFVKGPNVMLGYMTAEKPGKLQPLGEGWHDTGDIVAIDREGFLTIRGRLKRFAKIAGEMVSLGQAEMLVQALWPDDRHAVVAVPDRRRGERIVLVTTAAGADLGALRAGAKAAGMAEIAVPDTISRVEEIPVLGSGKVDYQAVRRMAIDALGLDAAA